MNETIAIIRYDALLNYNKLKDKKLQRFKTNPYKYFSGFLQEDPKNVYFLDYRLNSSYEIDLNNKQLTVFINEPEILEYIFRTHIKGHRFYGFIDTTKELENFLDTIITIDFLEFFRKGLM